MNHETITVTRTFGDTKTRAHEEPSLRIVAVTSPLAVTLPLEWSEADFEVAIVRDRVLKLAA